MMRIKIRVFSWFLSLFCSIGTEGLLVRGPAMPLIVQSGASVTLPCSVDPPIPLHELEVQWIREDSGALVHLFQDGESRPESQSPPYSGRAQFFTEEISKGNFSLLLRNVNTEDKGLYKCVVHSEHESNETKMKLDIERLVVRGANVPIFAYAGEDVVLNCSVDTHVPLRELEVEWMKTKEEIPVLLFAEGQEKPESQHERFRGRAEFFREEIPKGNFSLKLRDVKTGDRGEFMCTVHTARESVTVKAWLQEQGFSTLHMGVLGLSIAAIVFAVLSCIPAVWWIRKEQKENNKKGGETVFIALRDFEADSEKELSFQAGEKFHFIGDTEDSQWKVRSLNTGNTGNVPSSYVAPADSPIKAPDKRAVLLYCLQVSVPCILISIAFIIWGKIESSVGEAYVCSVINLMRILVIFKVAPYAFPGTCYKRFTNLALPLEHFLITTGMNSVVLQRFLRYSGTDAATKLFNGFFFVIVLLRGFSAVCSSGLMYSSGYNYLKYIINWEIFFLIFSRSARGFALVFIIWFIVPALEITVSLWQSDVSRKKYGYLCEKFLESLLYILRCALYLIFLDIISEKDKEHPALMCFIVFLCILTAIPIFNHRTDLPAVPHILVYVFGSAGLSVLNSASLATEVILKAGKGERTVEDLRVIVLPLESFFLACWLGLQVYAYCMQEIRLREQLRLIGQSCKKQDSSPTSSQKNQRLEEAEEMLPVSSAARSTTQTGGTRWLFQ